MRGKWKRLTVLAVAGLLFGFVLYAQADAKPRRCKQKAKQSQQDQDDKAGKDKARKCRKVTKPSPTPVADKAGDGGFPWRWIVIGLIVLAAAALVLRRRLSGDDGSWSRPSG